MTDTRACRISFSVKRGHYHAKNCVKRKKKASTCLLCMTLCRPLSLEPLTGGSTTEEMFLGHKCTIKVGRYEWPHLSVCVFGFRSCLPLGCGTFLGDLWKAPAAFGQESALLWYLRTGLVMTAPVQHTHTHTHKRIRMKPAWEFFSHTCIITWTRHPQFPLQLETKPFHIRLHSCFCMSSNVYKLVNVMSWFPRADSGVLFSVTNESN